MFDYLIKNGQLIDGTGSPARRADVGITDGKIAAIGDLSAAQAGTVIDAAGKTVTPGFIDIHRHADAALFRPHFGELELKQGLTTIVNGNCGLSITPCSGPYRGEIEAYLTPVTGELSADADCSSMQAYLDAARRQPSPIHTAMLAGSGTIRACAAGFSAPTLDAAQLRTPVEISHLKSIGKANWRSCTPEMLRLMAEARQEGVRIACDVYPYTAGSTQLVHVLPPETQQGGMEALTEHLADPAFRETLKARMLTGSDFENISLLAGFENFVVSSVRLDGLRQYEGQSIAQIAEQQGKDPFTCLFDLLQAAHCDVTMIDFIAAEDDICDILRDAHSCVISDSTYPTTGMLHPRVYGTYTTLLEHFVREKQVLSLEAAVHKVTGRPAAVMGLRTKGVLAQGMDADINIFDPAQIHTRATYQDPAQFSDGLDTVFVSGQPAILHGALTGRKDGTVLTR